MALNGQAIGLGQITVVPNVAVYGAIGLISRLCSQNLGDCVIKIQTVNFKKTGENFEYDWLCLTMTNNWSSRNSVKQKLGSWWFSINKHILPIRDIIHRRLKK